jgi:RimJ/RimL family protein N-acetyltransferase
VNLTQFGDLRGSCESAPDARDGVCVTGPVATPPPGAVALREISPADLPILFAQQRDPVANRMADFPAREEAAFMAHWTKILAEPTVTARTVLLDGRVAGNVVSFEHEGHREVGYWIGREFWGRGVATRALSVFLELVPERPLYAGVAPHNAASIRVLEKCGFTVAGQEDGGDVVFRLDDAAR